MHIDDGAQEVAGSGQRLPRQCEGPFSALVIPAFVEMAGRQRWADSWKFAGCYLVHKAKFKDNERPRRQVPGA